MRIDRGAASGDISRLWVSNAFKKTGVQWNGRTCLQWPMLGGFVDGCVDGGCAVGLFGASDQE